MPSTVEVSGSRSSIEKTDLEACKLHKRFNSFGIRFAAALDLLAAFSKASEAEVVGALGLEAFELRQKHTGDVLLPGSYAKLGGLD